MDVPFNTPDLPVVCDRCLRTGDICVCAGPYLEMLADGDQRENSVFFVCNQCDADVTEAPCPEHAPIDIPGLRIAECRASVPHQRTWVLDREDYGAMCPWCLAKEAGERHEGCEHAAHGRWRSWRVTRVVLSVLCRVGLVSYGFRYGGGCEGCRTAIRFGWRRSR